MKEYHPTEINRIIDFKQGPSGFQLPEIDQQHPEHFTFSQLYMLFNDVMNLIPIDPVKNKVSSNISFNFLCQKMKFRAKNNTIGICEFMPEFWVTKSLVLPDIQKILIKLVEKTVQFEAGEKIRHKDEAVFWRESKIELKRTLLLEQRKLARDRDIEEEKARLQELKELEEEAKLLEEEQQKGKKNRKKSTEDENNEGDAEEEEAEPFDEFYGFQTDE